MEAKRYIGIDLHRNCFTACLRLENGREYLKEWKLEDGEVHRQAALHRPGGRRGNGQHATVPRRGGAARRASRGREPQPVQGNHAFGEEDRSQ